MTEEEFIKQFGEGVSTLFDRGLAEERRIPTSGSARISRRLTHGL